MVIDAAVNVGGADGGSPAASADAALPANDASALPPAIEAGASGDAGSGDPSASSDAGNADAGALTPDSGSDAGPVAAAWKPKCVKKDSQVMVVGDSYINWISHDFPTQLKTATKMDWRMLAIGGTAMGSGGIGLIPDQFYDSIAEDPDAHTVLMDGGGNDILVPDITYDDPLFATCKEPGSSQKANCQMIIKIAIDAAGTLMDRAAAAGIRDVVYFFYPHIPEGRLIGGPHPNEILDYALPMVEKFCNGALERTQGKLRCTFISMIPVFEGHTPDIPGSTVPAGSEQDWFNDDIHPNSKGSQAMVNKVWEVMQQKCIGQKGKDCCEP
jgi:hypothetical protein